MRPRLSLALLAVAAAAASAAAPVSGPDLLEAARAEREAAEAEAARLTAAAERASGTAQRLALQRRAAASAILAAEARLSAASADLAQARSAVAGARARLAERQRPVATLVSAMVALERRPPLLALADGGSVEDLVRARALLATVMPYIRRRSAALQAELDRARALETRARQSLAALDDSRLALERERRRFAALESEALARAGAAGSAALEAGDQLILADEDIARLENAGTEAAQSRRIALALARVPSAPPAPSPVAAPRPPLAYRLPAAADVIDGEGAVSATGIRSRGIRLATRRGAPIVMPAAGRIVFSAPFRSHDGVIILDHGGGWMTMLVGARAEHQRGAHLPAGAPLGVALGEMVVELTRSGRPLSPAIAALDSRSLSIQAQRR